MDGAIRKSTGIYETPNQALPHEDYECIGCNGECFLRSGNVYRKHFSHKKEQNTCQQLDRVGSEGESAYHKTAKLLIKHILDTKRDFSIVRMCHMCQEEELFYIPVKDILEVIVEGKVSNGKADVLIKFKEEEIAIEIMNTHRVKSRTGTWFELTIQEISNKYQPEGPLVMNCNRNFRCDKCEEIVKREEEQRREEHRRQCIKREEERQRLEMELRKKRLDIEQKRLDYIKYQQEEERKQRERHILERERREREREEERRLYIERQERLQKEYEEQQIQERERNKQEKIEKERKQKEYDELYNKIHTEFYEKYITKQEQVPEEWNGKEAIIYKDFDFLHPKNIIRMVSSNRKTKSKPLK